MVVLMVGLMVACLFVAGPIAEDRVFAWESPDPDCLFD
jgi:hypothetical protein